MKQQGTNIMSNKTANEEVHSNQNGRGMFIFFCIITLGLLCIGYVAWGNYIKQLIQKMKQSRSDIDVSETKRAAVLAKMVETTQSEMKWEKSVQTQIAKLRSESFSNLSNQDVEKADKVMNDIAHQWNMNWEQYPNLKSDKAVNDLNDAIRDTEAEIAASRRIFNANVDAYNEYIVTWPHNIVAENRKLKTESYLLATDDEKADVNTALKAD